MPSGRIKEMPSPRNKQPLLLPRAVHARPYAEVEVQQLLDALAAANLPVDDEDDDEEDEEAQAEPLAAHPLHVVPGPSSPREMTPTRPQGLPAGEKELVVRVAPPEQSLQDAAELKKSSRPRKSSSRRKRAAGAPRTKTGESAVLPPPPEGQGIGRRGLAMMTGVMRCLPRCMGILPWHAETARGARASRAHQIIVTGLCGSAASLLIWNCIAAARDDTSMVASKGIMLQIAGDAALAISATLALLGCGVIFGSKGLAKVERVLDAYATRNEFLEKVSCRACIDTGFFFVIWLVAVALHCHTLMAASSFQNPGSLAIACEAAFAGAVAVLLACAGHVQHLCIYLNCMIGNFSTRVAENPNLVTASLKEWDTQHSLLKMVCRQVQYTLAAVACGAGLACLAVLVRGVIKRQVELSMAPQLIIGIGLLRVPISAASVSDCFEGISSIVNCLAGTKKELVSVERACAVLHVFHSRAAFIVLGVKLNKQLVFQILYISCASTAWFCTQVLLQAEK